MAGASSAYSKKTIGLTGCLSFKRAISRFYRRSQRMLKRSNVAHLVVVQWESRKKNVRGKGIYCSMALRCLRLQYHKSNSSVRAAHLNVVALSGREKGCEGSSKEKREGKKKGFVTKWNRVTGYRQYKKRENRWTCTTLCKRQNDRPKN